MNDPRADLDRIWRAALEAVDPMACVPPHLPPPPMGKLVVVGGGKASARMAEAVERHYDGPMEGLVVTRYGYGAQLTRLEQIEAGHPVPDQAGVAGAGRILEMVNQAGADDLVLVLLSGGGSALLAAPKKGLSLDDKRDLTDRLLRSGATIAEINTVRRHVSLIKGGQLACNRHSARMLTLALSDVPGDDPAVIASGPTVADPTSQADARSILRKYGIPPSPALAAVLENPEEETPKPSDPRLAHSDYRLVANPQTALDAAADAARTLGYETHIWSDRVEGEARAVANDHADAALRHSSADGQPSVFLSGGEVTVTGAGEASGGPNREYALALALALNGHERIWALAMDTDGIDGAPDGAGAIIRPDTLARARAAGLNTQAMLDGHRSGELFTTLSDALVTGPTCTNVGDLRIILIK